MYKTTRSQGTRAPYTRRQQVTRKHDTSGAARIRPAHNRMLRKVSWSVVDLPIAVIDLRVFHIDLLNSGMLIVRDSSILASTANLPLPFFDLEGRGPLLPNPKWRQI